MIPLIEARETEAKKDGKRSLSLFRFCSMLYKDREKPCKMLQSKGFKRDFSLSDTHTIV